MKENVMLDLETLGVRSGCAVIAIGAVKFTSDKLTERFYFLPTWTGRLEADTVRWWMGVDSGEAARREVLKPPHGTLEEGLLRFREFVGDSAVWGNGSDFDNVILQDRYGRLGIQAWDHRMNRCYKTLRNLHPSVPRIQSTIPHHALEDAIAQARHTMAIFNKVGIS